MTKLILANIIFILAMAVLILAHVTDWQIWLLFVVAWFVADYFLGRVANWKW